MPRSLSEIAASLDTDKQQSNTYLDNFERHFGPLRERPIKLLELGVLRGGSILMWHEYFSQGLIVGLDQLPNPLAKTPDRIRFYQGSQDDEQLLARLAYECAPDGFDIVLDDASHFGHLSRLSFRTLFQKHLKPGGLYVVEDWGTGYWGNWPDGSTYRPANEALVRQARWSPTLASRIAAKLRRFGRDPAPHLHTDPGFAAHNFGMVGFVKELVDEVAWPDITTRERGDSALGQRPSTIREMTLYCGHAFVVKA